MTNSMNVSFYERIGIARGFGESSVALTLIIYSIVSIFPAPIAAFTQKYLNPLAVICIGPIFQAIFSLVLTHS
ncbi:MFS transporter, partial [Acinetobacter baumannii]